MGIPFGYRANNLILKTDSDKLVEENLIAFVEGFHCLLIILFHLNFGGVCS